MKLKTLILLFTLLTFFASPLLSLAQEATDTATAEEIEKSLQDRIKKALDENKDSAEATVKQLTSRAFVGLVDSLAQNQITIKVNPGLSQAEYLAQAVYSDTTDFERGSKTIKPDNLQIGDYIIAIGTPDSDTSLTASRIVVSSYTPPTTQRLVVFATVSEVDLDDDTITLINSHAALEEPLDITKNTKLLGPQQTKLELKDFAPEQKVVAILALNSTKKTTTLQQLISFSTPQTPTPTTKVSTQSGQTSSRCGDGVCQNTACFGLDCPTPESPETCPADCTE